MDNRELIQKAKVGLDDLQAGSGTLAPAHAREFLRTAITEATLMPMAKVVPMKSHQQRINTVGLSSRVLRAGTPGQSVQEGAGQTGLDFTAPMFEAKLFRGEVPVEEEVLEDNIEQGRFRDTVLQLLPQAVGRDMDEVAISGDTASDDTFFAQFDGILKQASSNVVDFGGARIATPDADPFAKLTDMLRAVPRHHRRHRDRMVFLTSYKAEDDYRNALIGRSTPIGDSALTGDGLVRFKNRSLRNVGMWPEELGVGGDQTSLLLVDPKNIQFGVWREVKIKVHEEPREGMIYFIVSLRFDVKIAVEDASVKGINILNG